MNFLVDYSNHAFCNVCGLTHTHTEKKQHGFFFFFLFIDHGTTLCHLWWRQSVCLCVQAHSCKYCNLRAIHYRNIKLTPQVPTEKSFWCGFWSTLLCGFAYKKKISSSWAYYSSVSVLSEYKLCWHRKIHSVAPIYILTGYETCITCLSNVW